MSQNCRYLTSKATKYSYTRKRLMFQFLVRSPTLSFKLSCTCLDWASDNSFGLVFPLCTPRSGRGSEPYENYFGWLVLKVMPTAFVTRLASSHFSRECQWRRSRFCLGTAASKITQKHYSPWVIERQERLESNLRKSWEHDPIARSGELFEKSATRLIN
jgi:hypothetical protein